jgi:nucleoside-diphosphate-sugar epimerase
MNMAQTLAAQAAICRATGRPFVFPGSRTQWEGLTDMTSADLLAEHLHWAATTPGVADTALNIVNGDVFRWRWMWPRLAEALGVEPVGFETAPRPLEEQMADAGPAWERLAADHGLTEPDLDRVASWWHTDSDLGRDVECLTDMRRSRVAGFTGFRPTLDSFLEVFDELVAQRVVPAPTA